ncbi:MAG TPA: lysophospholipid acyltransferase family protein [Leptolinea sp.]
MKHKFLHFILNLAVRLFTRTEFLQCENIPKKGGFILATNHNSRLDSPILYSNPVRPDLIALIATEYRSNLFFWILLQAAEVIWLDRSKADFSAFRKAVEVIKQGHVIGIAPEGTRSRVGRMLEGKPGILLLTTRADVPIVPVGITGTEDMMQKILALHKPKITVRFGKAFTLPPIPRENRDGAMQQNTTEVMCQIAALLPEKYRGFYREFTRVGEIIRENGYPDLG